MIPHIGLELFLDNGASEVVANDEAASANVEPRVPDPVWRTVEQGHRRLGGVFLRAKEPKDVAWL